jgi:hypothetical protein
MAHITRSRWMMLRNQMTPQHTVDLRCKVKQRGAFASADVEHRRTAGGCIRRCQVCIDHVLDIGKIARLQSIAIDDRRQPAHHAINETRDHGGIFGVRVLSRTKDVK